MLHMFAMIFKCFQMLSQVFQMLISSASSFCMLQQLHLNVSKVDRVLYIECVWKTAGNVGDVRGCTGLQLGRSLAVRGPSGH
jgi:hypothetical protein